MPLPVEQTDFNQNFGLRDNDKEVRDYLRVLMNRGTLALNLRTYLAAATIDPKIFFAICDTTAGAFNLTLLQANYLGTTKTPCYLIHHLAGAGAFNVVPAGADTINGGGAFAIAVGGFYLFFSNGNNAWYARAI